MSVLTLGLTAAPTHRPPKWRQLRAELRQRARSGDEPKTLDDHQISDVALRQASAADESFLSA